MIAFGTYNGPLLDGARWHARPGQTGYPDAFSTLKSPPKELYGIGDPDVVREGLSVVGARKATPYGLACAKHFATLAAQQGITIISGGALGCDSAAHDAALGARGKTVVFLGGGCDQIYPARNFGLFQRIVDAGGAIVSEYPFDHPALPYTFRLRNRLIAALGKATLIVEAGLPSGTFSTADEALSADREVLVVPGAITSATSAGANRLLYQGATPIVDDDTFLDQLQSIFGTLILRGEQSKVAAVSDDVMLAALQAEPLRIDQMLSVLQPPRSWEGSAQAWVSVHLAELEQLGLVKRFPDGRFGPANVS